MSSTPLPMDPIETALWAGIPLVYVTSPEEERIVAAVERSCRRANRQCWLHTISKGLWTVTFRDTDEAGSEAVHEKPDPRLNDPVTLLEYIAELRIPPRGAAYLLLDFHECLRDPVVQRHVRDLVTMMKKDNGTIFIAAPVTDLPACLATDALRIDLPLPSPEERAGHLQTVLHTLRERGLPIGCPSDQDHLTMADIGAGLTLNRLETCLAFSAVRHNGVIDVAFFDDMRHTRQRMINQSGFLELINTAPDSASIGGLSALKAWLDRRRNGFTRQARDFGLPAPRGLLLLGVPGCGKSLAARAASSRWRLPLLRLDTGRLFTSRVGGSEARVRETLHTAEALSPCILWIDEIEKAMAGLNGSGDSDAGTAARVFAALITWMQEKTAPVFVLATANTVAALPAELLRKGRWDDIFFVDLPGLGERREIFAIHLAAHRQDPAAFDIRTLAEHSRGFSGAEIKQVVIEAMYAAFDDNQVLTTDRLLEVIRQQVPLSVTRQEDIQTLREWAATSARPASRDELQSQRNDWCRGTVKDFSALSQQQRSDG